MNQKATPDVTAAPAAIDSVVLNELTRRVEDIDNSYRSIAEKVGQLYLRAEEVNAEFVTSHLDKPMRNASENEQMFAALLDMLKMQKNQRQ